MSNLSLMKHKFIMDRHRSAFKFLLNLELTTQFKIHYSPEQKFFSKLLMLLDDITHLLFETKNGRFCRAENTFDEQNEHTSKYFKCTIPNVFSSLFDIRKCPYCLQFTSTTLFWWLSGDLREFPSVRHAADRLHSQKTSESFAIFTFIIARLCLKLFLYFMIIRFFFI